MIKLISFDWNGTILADTYAVLEADNEVLKTFGKEPISLKQLQETFDVPIVSYYKNLGYSEEEFLENSEKISHLFHTYYENQVTKCRTRRNTRRLLKWLSKEELESIILSNHITKRIEEQLKRLKIENYFSKILGNDHRRIVQTKLTKREKLKNYLLKKEMSFREVLIVGDGLEEIEIARELGSLCAAITDGNYSTPRLKAAKPDYLISDLGNLINIIREINTA